MLWEKVARSLFCEWKNFQLAGNCDPCHETTMFEHEQDLILFALYILITSKM